MFRKVSTGISVAALGIILAARADVAPEPISKVPTDMPTAHMVNSGYKVVEVASGLDRPWSMAFLPDGSMLVTERPGRLRIIRGGKLLSDAVANVPTVYTKSPSKLYQAGLFDVVLHPKFAENNILYLTYASGNDGANATRVMRARFDGKALLDAKVIFEARPLKDTANHFGGRMAFLPDGTFLLTVGEGFEYREKAQDLSTDLGKIIRLNDDGSVPKDNPFVAKKSALPEIYSLGHRNEQGLIYDAINSRVLETEHGPQGGDELNVIEPGRNYGWPVITYGMDYTGAYVTPYTAWPGMEQPRVQWTPSIAPSGLALYTGDKFANWKGDLFVGSLKFMQLRRLDLDESGRVQGQEILMSETKQRIRDVRVGPDGFLYVATDHEPGEPSGGRVLRLEPAG